MSLTESDIVDPAGAADEADEAPSTQEDQFEKPRAGVYTMMLIVSFFALLIGIFCLHQEMKSYDFDFNAKGAQRGAPKDDSGPDLGKQSTRLRPTERERALVLGGPRCFDPFA